MNILLLLDGLFGTNFFSETLKLIGIEAIYKNQTDVCILLRAEMMKKSVKANFEDLGKKTCFQSVVDTLFCTRSKQYIHIQGYAVKNPKIQE